MARLRLRGRRSPLAISGPLWLGPLQHGPTLAAMADRAASASPDAVDAASLRLLRRLQADPGPARALLALGGAGPALGQGRPLPTALLAALLAGGLHRACARG
jgi:tRNA (guanine26-N2/guanine27-N2)-dimethyltransferase